MNVGRKLHLLRRYFQIPMNTKPKRFWWKETPWHSFFRSLFESFLISFKKLVDLSRSTLLGFGYVENYRERVETRLWRLFYGVNPLLFLYLETFSRKNEERGEDSRRFALSHTWFEHEEKNKLHWREEVRSLPCWIQMMMKSRNLYETRSWSFR
jgi:hypothetical protein